MKMQSTLPAMKIEVDRNDSYAELVNRAAEAFNLSEKPGNNYIKVAGQPCECSCSIV